MFIENVYVFMERKIKCLLNHRNNISEPLISDFGNASPLLLQAKWYCIKQRILCIVADLVHVSSTEAANLYLLQTAGAGSGEQVAQNQR